MLDTSLIGPLIIPDERSPVFERLETALLETAILVPAGASGGDRHDTGRDQA